MGLALKVQAQAGLGPGPTSGLDPSSDVGLRAGVRPGPITTLASFQVQF